jgi:pimeloyl-ACP methyl ester carboxylesterase
MQELSTIRNSHGEALDFTFHPSKKDDYLVIIGHGVTGNKDRPLLMAIADGLAARGWPCLRFSYAGNGNSEGDFAASTITKEISDLQSVFEALPKGKKIAYCGHSMGGAVGVLTAVRDERLQVLITLAGMVHTKEFCQREFGDVVPDQGLMWEDPQCPLSQAYVDDLGHIDSTLEAAAAMEVPWLLIHGDHDDVVPVTDSQAAYAVAPEPKKLHIVAGAEHSFSDQTYQEVVHQIDEWLIDHFH